MIMNINREATERLETVRRLYTNLHFADRLTREEEAYKAELHKEYNALTEKYKIVTVYEALEYRENEKMRWVVIGTANTREEARELIKHLPSYKSDIRDVEICCEK